MQLLITEHPLPAGSGEIMNDTLEGAQTVDGAPITDVGSGDGAVLHVIEEVSQCSCHLTGQ